MKSINTFTAFLLITTSIFAQPTFDPGEDPKPADMKWEKIENMSDEFNGTSLDTQKWDNQDPQWRGRQPALFTTNAVSVDGGSLQITASKDLSQELQNQNPGYYMQGGLVRSKNKATYGYYETRMKANRTFMSSTFWLINKRNEFTGCDERVTELDVTENVGVNSGDPTRNWVNQNIVSINSNTHSRGVVGNPGCGIAEFFRGDKSPIGEPAYTDYHVYGVFWKSATELLFYLDGKKVYEVVPPADFDLAMYLRMVVETYNWNPPNSTIVNGERVDKMDETEANRTTFYDWTRSWKLVDNTLSNEDFEEHKNKVAVFPNPLRNNRLNISLPITSQNSETVNVVVYNFEGRTVQEETLPFNTDLSFIVDPRLADSMYLIKITTGDIEHVEKVIIQD